MTLMGIAMPFYSIGSDSMVADMVEREKLPSAYTILRMANNAGIAIGPAIGRILISKSYTLAFFLPLERWLHMNYYYYYFHTKL